MTNKHPIVEHLEAQDDLRRELLRFCRFIEAQGYELCRVLPHGGWAVELTYPGPVFNELVEQALQADEIDWFAQAQQAGYAQDGGKTEPSGKNMRQVQHTCGCLLLQSVYGNVTCWYVYRDAEAGPTSPLIALCPCCQRPLEDTDMSPVDERDVQPFAQDPLIQEVVRSNVHEADALITDACYLLNMEADGELIGNELKEWRTRWLDAAGAYLMSIGGAP